MTTKTFSEPVQDRSRRSFERMVEAGKELIRTSPDGSFSIQDLAKHSGTSVGSIYQRFGKKDTLTLVLHKAIMDRLDREAEARFERVAPASPEAAVAAAIHAFCDHVMDNQDVLSRMVMQNGAVGESHMRGMESSRHIGRLFQECLDRHLGPDPLRHEVVFRMVYGMMWRQMFETDDSEYLHPLSREALRQGMIDMARAYLLEG